jgi:hypothetical protein
MHVAGGEVTVRSLLKFLALAADRGLETACRRYRICLGFVQIDTGLPNRRFKVVHFGVCFHRAG